MGRKPKTNRVPRTRAGGEWTEAAFWNFLHSQFRKASMRWPPIARLALERARRPATPEDGYNKQTKWVYECAGCGCWSNRKGVHVDHITPVGRLRSYEDAGPYLQRLFCETDDLQVLCHDCNYTKKAADKLAQNKEESDGD